MPQRRVRARLTTAQRGYGGAHARLRAQWKPAVDAGQVECHAVICLKPPRPDGLPRRWIEPGTPWHLGHTPDRTAWTGPEHEQCNVTEANNRRNSTRGQRLRGVPRGAPWITSRRW